MSFVLFYYMCIAVLHTLVTALLARSQYLEGPVTGHLGTGFSWFPCVYKRMLRWFPRLQVAPAQMWIEEILVRGYRILHKLPEVDGIYIY
jgi:hypothetical protein